MHDLVIRNGTVVDGTGADRRRADVAVDGDRITEVGEVAAAGVEELSADGRIVMPGIVDVHTHYDGQVTWDPVLRPSTWHGVTTLVMGNCGVGFAPARPDRHDWLIGLMEGVEDIPGAALSEGIEWRWESFPEYLDHLDTLDLSVDVGTQVPHGAVRAYVMGERGARNEPATTEDIAAMADIVREGIEAGALGFSTSRTIAHRAIDGEPVPGTFAAEDELFGIGRVLGDLDTAVFELAPAGAAGEDLVNPPKEVDWMCRLSAEIGRPVTFALTQNDAAPDQWRELADLSYEAVERGARVHPQVAGRPFGLLLSHATTNAFIDRPSYAALADLPYGEKIDRLRDPELRACVLAEEVARRDPIAEFVRNSYHKMYVLGDPPDYEPGPELTVQSIADREGRTPDEVLYDLLLEDDGANMLMFPLLNYSYGSCDALREMLLHPAAALGLGDGGAHCGLICDASIPTFMLSHWVRDRTRGEKLPLEWVVKKQTHDTAQLFGLGDRGTLEKGQKADINVVDLERIRLQRPEAAWDLPAGGKRLLQAAEGYVATVVSGVVTQRHGEDTGARPGRLVRGAR